MTDGTPIPPTSATSPASPSVAALTVPPEFVMKRDGKDFILYRGLLALAHQQGLESITVEILQYPTAENNQTTVCKATVTTGIGVFTEVGDANAQNTGRLIAQHAIRMAATRAKARALRDAVNVGLVAIEELGGDDGAAEAAGSHEAGRRTQSASGAVPRPSTPAAVAAAPGSGPTAAAVERIRIGDQLFSREAVWSGYSARRVAALNAGTIGTGHPLAGLLPESPLAELVGAAQRLRRLMEPPPELEGEPAQEPPADEGDRGQA
jgi:hypothetical protein